MAKAKDAFRTISEVAEWLDTPTHVLRFWESKFSQIKPVKRAGGRRYYRKSDMELLGGLKKLLHEDGLTIKGAQKVLREQGVKAVAALSAPVDMDDAGIEAHAPEQEQVQEHEHEHEQDAVPAASIPADDRSDAVTRAETAGEPPPPPPLAPWRSTSGE